MRYSESPGQMQTYAMPKRACPSEAGADLRVLGVGQPGAVQRQRLAPRRFHRRGLLALPQQPPRPAELGGHRADEADRDVDHEERDENDVVEALAGLSARNSALC